MVTATENETAIDTSNPILAASGQAARVAGLKYAGNVTPEQAWTLFSEGQAGLIDVRTLQELQQTGHVPNAAHIEWLHGVERSINKQFIAELEALSDKNEVVLFLCRSGVRSISAAQAATQAGFSNAYNVTEGFEGNGNPRLGWLNRKLPSIHE